MLLDFLDVFVELPAKALLFVVLNSDARWLNVWVKCTLGLCVLSIFSLPLLEHLP